jgi:hypothetical protein
MAVLPLLPDVTPQNNEYEERAAILEFDGGFARADAERKAFEYTLTEGDHYHAQKAKDYN